jgi:guanylate kinase
LNKLIIVTAPSGAGKSTLVKFLMQHQPNLAFSISATTRQARQGEQHGQHYYFINTTEFQALIDSNSFLEWECVYAGKYYGTLKTELNRIWALGKTPILDIDVQGAINVQQQYASQTCSIFIQAPNIAELQNRLAARGTETPETLAERVNKAESEMEYATQFNHIIVNDQLQNAQNEIVAIVNHFLSSNA